MVKPIPTFLVAALARNDLARINNTLFDLQRQTASGNLASDLKGYGQEAGRIVSARTAITQSNVRVDVANRLASRLDVQDTALGRASEAAATLKQQLLEALAADDGSYVAGQVETAFNQATQALNTTHEGVALFSGDRRGASPVRVSDIGDLADALTQATLFQDATRTQSIDLGVSGPIKVADRVSDIASPLYTALSDLHTFATTSGLGKPITDAQRTTLNALIDDLEVGHLTLLESQGRNGIRQATLERTVTRLTVHADLLTKHLGKVAEADLAEVAMRLSAAQTQYQAAASVFSQIKDLSLVNFLD